MDCSRAVQVSNLDRVFFSRESQIIIIRGQAAAAAAPLQGKTCLCGRRSCLGSKKKKSRGGTLTCLLNRPTRTNERREVQLKQQQHQRLELERVPDPAKRPGPKEKLALNKLNGRFYLSSNFGKARELFGMLDRAQKNVRYTSLQ